LPLARLLSLLVWLVCVVVARFVKVCGHLMNLIVARELEVIDDECCAASGGEGA